MMRHTIGINVVWIATNDELEGTGRIDTVYLSVMSREEVPDVLPLTGVGHDAQVRVASPSCKEQELKMRMNLRPACSIEALNSDG